MDELRAVPKPKRTKKPKPTRRVYEELTLNEKKDILWKVFSRWVRYRDDGVCYTCGKKCDPMKTQAGHYEKRKKAPTFVDPRNVHAQCETCNMWKEGAPHEYAERLVRDYGPTILTDLKVLSNGTKKFTHEELKLLTLEYERMLRELGGTPLGRPKMLHEREGVKI